MELEEIVSRDWLTEEQIQYVTEQAKKGAIWAVKCIHNIHPEEGLIMAKIYYDAYIAESVGVKQSPSETFPRVNEFDTGSSYRN